MSTAEQERDQALDELAKATGLKERYARTAADLLGQRDNHAAQAERDRADLAKSREVIDRLTSERDEARAERDRLAAALVAIDDWGIRHSEALDAAATAQQLRDELRGGAQ